MADSFISATQAGAILNLSTDHLRLLARTGRIRSFKAGTRWLFRREDIEAIVKDGVQPAADPVPYVPRSARR